MLRRVTRGKVTPPELRSDNVRNVAGKSDANKSDAAKSDAANSDAGEMRCGEASQAATSRIPRSLFSPFYVFRRIFPHSLKAVNKIRMRKRNLIPRWGLGNHAWSRAVGHSTYCGYIGYERIQKNFPPYLTEFILKYNR